MVIQSGTLKGLFTGLHGRQTLFRFTDGAVWQQAEDKQLSAFCFDPIARVIAQQGMCFLEVEGLEEWVQVSRQHRCEEG